MTVAELIAALQALPPDARVVVNGYEHGVDDIVAPRPIKINPDTNSKEDWFAGPHETRDDGIEPAVYIGATRDNDPS